MRLLATQTAVHGTAGKCQSLFRDHKVRFHSKYTRQHIDRFTTTNHVIRVMSAHDHKPNTNCDLIKCPINYEQS